MHQANLNETTRKALWNEAVNYANDTVNLTWSRTTKSNPYVMMNRQKSRLGNYVQPFGRIGEVRTKEKIKGKWSEKSIRMIMVGYAKNTTTDTYRMFNPSTKKVWVTRNVIWMDWRRQNPQRDPELFGQISSELKQPCWN